MNNNETWETGAHSHAVNNLILWCENTRHLAEQRDIIFNDFKDDTRQRDYVKFTTKQTVYKGLRLATLLSLTLTDFNIKNEEDSIELDLDQQRDFVNIYFGYYEDWLIEQKNETEISKG